MGNGQNDERLSPGSQTNLILFRKASRNELRGAFLLGGVQSKGLIKVKKV